MNMREYKLPEDTLVAVVNYLAAHPFNQVAELITKIQADAKLIVESEEKED